MGGWRGYACRLKVMTAAMSEPPKQEKVRWGLVVLALAVPGIAMVGAAFILEWAWEWTGVSVGTLVNLGTALLLAAFLTGLQRHLTTTVKKEVQAAEDRFETRARGIEGRLDELGEATRARIQAEDAAMDAAVAALAETATYETVTEAMLQASDLRALVAGTAHVQACPTPDVLDLTFEWVRRTRDLGRVGANRFLRIGADVWAHINRGGPLPVIETVWESGEPAEEVGRRLTRLLQEAGGVPDEGFDWPLALRNLQRTIDVAVRARRKDSGAWRLVGALFELVGDDWALTEAGVESPPHTYVLSQSEFPDRNRPMHTYFDERGLPKTQPPWPPEAPAWAEAAEWASVIRRGERWFPRSPMAGLYETEYVPERSDSEKPGGGTALP
jgi:hypothetical protein